MSADGLESWAPFLVLLLAVVIVLIRNRRPRRLRVNRLWIIPALVTVGVGMGVYFGRPPIGYHWVDVVLCLVALVLGAAAGWWRGKFMRINVDPESETVTAQASPLGLLLILGLLAVRRFVQFEVETGAVPLPFKPAALIEPLLYFAVATVVVQRLEMWLRARKLLREARAGRSGGSQAAA